MTFVKTALFHKAGEGSGGGGGGGSDPHNLGWYATESALTTAHPTASNGDWAIVGATDTVWVWDSDTTAWKDTDTKGQVTSVNGQTGAVTVDTLPDQTGQSGKFLTTDGTDASWSDKVVVDSGNKTVASSCYAIFNGTSSGPYGSIAVGGIATGAESVTVGGNSSGLRSASVAGNATGSESTAVGVYAHAYANYSTVIGKNSEVASGANYGIAIGRGAQVGINAVHAIQIGSQGTSYEVNSDANTVKIANANGNYEMMSADGTIPTARLTKVNSTITLTAAGWSSNTQTVSVTGMTATGVVLVSPAPADQSAYTSAGILCTAQAAGTLTFTCDTVPSGDLSVNVVML